MNEKYEISDHIEFYEKPENLIPRLILTYFYTENTLQRCSIESYFTMYLVNKKEFQDFLDVLEERELMKVLHGNLNKNEETVMLVPTKLGEEVGGVFEREEILNGHPSSIRLSAMIISKRLSKNDKRYELPENVDVVEEYLKSLTPETWSKKKAEFACGVA